MCKVWPGDLRVNFLLLFLWSMMQGIKLFYSQSSICIKYIYLVVPSEADSIWAHSAPWNHFIPNWKSWKSQGVGGVWFSRPLFQAVSHSFFTVKQNWKAGYSKSRISEISQSQGPRHPSVLQLTWSHMAHHFKTFEQGSFFILKIEHKFSFFRDKNAATEIVRGQSTGSKHQSLNYAERCRAIRTGFCFTVGSTHTYAFPPRCRMNRQKHLKPRKVYEWVWNCHYHHFSAVTALKRSIFMMKPKYGCNFLIAGSRHLALALCWS